MTDIALMLVGALSVIVAAISVWRFVQTLKGEAALVRRLRNDAQFIEMVKLRNMVAHTDLVTLSPADRAALLDAVLAHIQSMPRPEQRALRAAVKQPSPKGRIDYLMKVLGEATAKLAT